MRELDKKYIEALVTSAQYFYTKQLTICVITAKNGFQCLGKARTTDQLKLNSVMGENIAYNNAIAELWSHEGYLATQDFYNKTKY
jgi:hypothetical protein